MKEKTNSVNGFLIINKPAGITSHDVVNHVRKFISSQAKPRGRHRRLYAVGHAGTLDPFATGVLLVAVGNTTRLLEYAKDFPKTYQAEVTLGATSDTDDLTGTLNPSHNVQAPSQEQVETTLHSFIGPIQQIPPAYAAIKIKGKKLYEYARRGETVERKPRKVVIQSIKLISYTYPLLTLEVNCGSGTYIRALGRDIGEKLGTGGYVSHLERKSVHKFHISQALDPIKLSTVTLTSALLPQESLINHLGQVTLSPADVAKWHTGAPIEIDHKIPINQPIAVFARDSEELIGIGYISEDTPTLLRPKKVF